LKSFNTLTNYFVLKHDGALKNEIEFLKILEFSKTLAQTFFPPMKTFTKTLSHKFLTKVSTFKRFPNNLWFS
jgi:hypothetical protein